MFIVPLSGLQSLGPAGEEGIRSTGEEAEGRIPFKQLLKESIADLQETQAAVRQDTYDLVSGSTSDLHNLSIHAAMQQTALEITVQMASRAVSAYKEVLQMQV